jgi:hypothetical protein
MKWTKVLGWMALLFVAVFAVIYFSVSETRANDPRSENVITLIKEGYHYITPAEASQLKANYIRHERAGTLKERPDYEEFNPAEINALTSLAGKKVRIYTKTAHADGTPVTLIEYAGYEMQKGTPCCPDIEPANNIPIPAIDKQKDMTNR